MILMDEFFCVGEPRLESFKKESLLSKTHLAKDLGIYVIRKWILITVHTET